MDKRCSNCGDNLHRDQFHMDKRRTDGLYPWCKNCRRLYYGSKEMPERIPCVCSYCKEPVPRVPSQFRLNKTGLFFCSEQHLFQYRNEHSKSDYRGYRPHILERDGEQCVICAVTSGLHIHHIITRGAGGKDDYQNLITLCGHCHITKAHGVAAAEYRMQFLAYTARFETPDFWGEIMAKSQEDRGMILFRKRKLARQAYNRVKKSPAYQEYRQKKKAEYRDRVAKYKATHGVSYDRYLKTRGAQSKPRTNDDSTSGNKNRSKSFQALE